jgi:hypothetical protein
MKEFNCLLLSGLKYKVCFFFALIGFTSFAQSKKTLLLNDVRTFEVSACKPSKKEIIATWMEKRPARKDNSEDAADMRVAYKLSVNNGETWSEKKIIDDADTFAIGNPFITCTNNKQAYLVCMHIGKDFWSGNISFYEFDFETKQFNLKSIPIESPNSLLDKPAIVISGNEVHLVYVAYPKGKKNAVRYQMSRDSGKSWTSPIDVFDSAGGHLGPSITLTANQEVIVSIGAYGSKNIQIAKKTISENTFQEPIIVTKVVPELGAAMTELNRFDDKLILTWQNPHRLNQTWLSYSVNNGNNWSAPYLITPYGNLLSAVFDKKGFLHCIYSNFSDNSFSVGYKKLDNEFKLLQDEYLQKTIPLNGFTEYLGAYQKLLIQDDELFAFWINYPNESSLNFSKWPIK